MAEKTKEPVVVIGAGLGGLMLARVLQVHGKPVVVYEREASDAARSQGGVLDMHDTSGLWALQEAGLEEAFMARAIPGGQDLRILDKAAQVLWDETGPSNAQGRPEIDRPALRSILLRALRPGTVRWGHALKDIVAQAGGHTLTFANAGTVHGKVVVGADGGRSRVRPLLTEANPAYCGVMFVECSILGTAPAFSDVAAIVGRGSMFALGDNKGILAHRCGDGRIAFYAALRMREDAWDDVGIRGEDPRAIRAGLVKQFADWSPDIKRLIEACEDTMVRRGIHAMPLGTRWPSRPDITVLGDAAHLMSPFAGEGANLALQDGAALALALVYQRPADAIAFFESRMFERAAIAGRDSAAGLETCMAPDGAQRMAAMMAAFASPGKAAPPGQGASERA